MIHSLALGPSNRELRQVGHRPISGKALLHTKPCNRCGSEKPNTPEHFGWQLGKLRAMCRECTRAAKRAAWAANADEINTKRRANRSEADRERERQYYRANAKKRAAIDAWRARNPERKKEIDAKHYRKVAARRIAQAKEWKDRNRERARSNMNAWHERRRKTDPAFRIHKSMSALVWYHLKRGKDGRRTEEVLGYTVPELMAHLERQFVGGMSWANYGEWHVDHIVPASKFDFASPDDPEFRACWALTNLRPLWGKDNIAKSDKRILLI